MYAHLGISKDSAALGKVLTRHARKQMNARRLPLAALQAALEYGRVFHARGAVIHVIGRKEVERYEREGVKLGAYEGVQVVCSPDGKVMTAYRNRNLRELRPRRRRIRRRA